MRFQSALFLTLAATAAGAQITAWNAPTLRIVDSIRIDVSKEQLWGLTGMAVRNDGSLAIIGRAGTLVYFDSLGKRRWTRNARGDVRFVENLNWKGDSIVLIDNLADQFLTVGSNGGFGDI